MYANIFAGIFDDQIHPAEDQEVMNDGLSTRDYIEDYCIHRIRRDNVQIRNYDHVRRDSVNAIAQRIREIGNQIETSNPEFFAQVCQQLSVTQTTAYAQFKDLADELFKDSEDGRSGISWGRIAALIAFSGRLSLHCATHDLEELVPSVIGWTARYLDQNVSGWMRDHQGWTGFLEFFDPDHAERRAQEALSGFVKTAVGYAAIGVGLAALASVFLRR